MWARIDGDRVAEITDIDPAGRFHPSLAWEDVSSDVKPGMVREGAGGFKWPDPEPDPIPQSVTRRQAKQQLLIAGLIADVQPAIDAIADDTERAMVQIYWDDATEFERAHPDLISLGHALSLTDVQIDDLFVAAAKL